MSPHAPGLPAWNCSSWASQHPRHSKCLPCSNQSAITTWRTDHIGCFYTRSLSSQQMRDLKEKTGELQEFSRICRDSPLSKVLVSAIVYISLYFHRVREAVMQVLWPCMTQCIPNHIAQNPFWSLNKGNKQDQQGTSPPHLELLVQ